MSATATAYPPQTTSYLKGETLGNNSRLIENNTPTMETEIDYPTCPLLNVSAKLEKATALFYPEGISFCDIIDYHLSREEDVEISFKGLEKVSLPFLNAALGLIYCKYPSWKTDNLIHFVGMTSDIERKINEVKWRAQNRELHNTLLLNTLAAI